MDSRSKTGKRPEDITITSILNGEIGAEDIKISKEVLQYQGEVARKSGRPQVDENFKRAAELVDIPDELIFEIYNKLRPNRATKQELMELAHLLSHKYKAYNCAKLVSEAAQIYEKRSILK
jgi:propanediol dehydratase small subunit